MTVQRLMSIAVALLLACTLAVAGCGSAETTVTTGTVVSDGTTVPTATAQLYPVKVDGKWGFIDSTGTVKIEPRFEMGVGSPGFSEGLAAVGVAEGAEPRFGYIDGTGAWVIKPQFDSVSDFSDGLAAVGNHTGLDGYRYMAVGYIDTAGSMVIRMRYYMGAPAFHEGLAVVTSEDYSSQNFMDKTGATVLGPYDLAYDFSEGLAYVEDGGKRGFIDKSGAWVVELESAMRDVWASGSYIPATGFSEGLMPLQPTPETSTDKGYVDKTGAWVIQPQFVGAYDFSEGLAAVAVGTTDAMKWGYIDKTGAWVVQPQFDYAWDFSDGLAAVQVNEGDSIKSGYIDKTGKVVIPLQYEWAYDFSGGIAQVTYPYPSTSPSYIDKTGKVIWRDINASVSVDKGTHRATIQYRTSGAFAMTALFLTYPDGRREMLGKGNIASGGASLGTAELSPGNYTYTVYWVPQEDQDPDSASAETLVETGQEASGNFTVE